MPLLATALNAEAASMPVEYVTPVRVRNSVKIDGGIMDDLSFGWMMV